MDLRFVEAPGIAEQPSDAAVRGAALRAEVQAIRPREHLVEAVERLVVAPEHLEDIAEVMERAELLLRRPLGPVAEEPEALHVVLGGLPVRVALASEVRGVEVRRRRLDDEPGLFLMPGEHAHVLLVRAHVGLEREPVGDRFVEAPRLRARQELEQRLALEIVFEDDLLVVRERAVRQREDVVALLQLLERLPDPRDVGDDIARPDVGAVDVEPFHREEAAEPEDASHHRRALEQNALLRSEGGDACLDGIFDRERELHLGQAIEVDDPPLLLGELVLHLDHAHVVEDVDHALEERGIAAGERARGVDELLDALRFSARDEELTHHPRRVRLREG